MLRFQIALTIILVGCMAFVSCGGQRQPALVAPVVDDMSTDMSMEMTEMMAAHKSWASVMLPAPMMTVEEAAAAMNPGGTGAIHGEGPRTVYFNEAAAMANRAGTAYPVGTMIVKEIMDDANMFVEKIAKMEKTDDPMYAPHGGWMYVKYARASEMDEYMMVGGGSLEASTGCHGCHAKASETLMKPTDSVFVTLPMDDTTMDDTTMDDTTMDDTTIDDGMGDNGAGNGDANGNGAGNGDANGNGAAQ